jgi:hypothetical protein
MDPDETLASMRRAAETITRLDNDRPEDFGTTNAEIAIHAVTLAENLQALDHWLKSKGFLPEDWRR